MAFDNLNLHPKILKAIAGAGYSEPTEIQSKAIPKVLEGIDLRASAQTGTGKTAAFLLPALHLLASSEHKPGKGPKVLILVPTRELGMQIAVQAEKYSKYLDDVKTVCIGGGVPYHKQLPKLSRPYDILIATPGRLIDFMNQRKIQFPRLEMLVLDEADRMLDMGFMDPVEEIVAATPSTRQTMLFSATLPKGVLKLSERLLKKPVDITVHADKAKHESIEQKLHYVDDLHHKNRLLHHILKSDEVNSTIVFTSTKRHADQLVRELKDEGHVAAAIHGDLNQRQRTRTIMLLRTGKIDILVATDVAARGIDVQSITHVINFDLPRNIEDYVHRIGRTGRAGANGTALSFASGRDSFLVKKIESFTGQKIDVSEVKGLEPRGKKGSFGSKEGPRREHDPKRRFKKAGSKPFRKSGAKSFGKPGAKPFQKSGDKSFSKPGAKPFQKSGAKSFSKPGAKPFQKSGAKSFGKPGAKPAGKKGFRPKKARI